MMMMMMTTTTTTTTTIMMEPSQFGKVTVCGVSLLSQNMLEVHTITKKTVKLQTLTALESMSGLRRCGVEGLTLTFGSDSLFHEWREIL
jgi:hypothetical protein